MKKVLKIAPWILWGWSGWKVFLVMVALASGLLAGKLDDPQVQGAITRLALTALGWAAVAVVVHVLVARQMKKMSDS